MLFLLLLLVHRSAFRTLPPTLLAEREQPFPVGRIDAAISGAPVRIVVFPSVRCLHGCPRGLRRFQRLQTGGPKAHALGKPPSLNPNLS
jgi:hypothetical protein